MNDYRKGLEDIHRMCCASRTYNRRTQSINDVAMVALGMTKNQRHEKHVEVMDRIGHAPLKDAYLKRKQKRDEKFPDGEQP